MTMCGEYKLMISIKVFIEIRYITYTRVAVFHANTKEVLIQDVSIPFKITKQTFVST